MTISLIHPVNGPITQKFGENPEYYSQWGFPGHNGIDFAVPNGTPVVAAADGTVDKIAFENGGYGNYVRLKHLAGTSVFYTYYAHLMHTVVAVGQSVKAGTVIAYSDDTGASTGPHLHFGLRSSNQSGPYKGYMDPLPHLSSPQPTPPSYADFPGSIPLSDVKFEVIVHELNVRNGPGITYSIVDKLKRGTVITPRRIHSQSAWVEIANGKWCAITFSGSAFVKMVK